MLDCLVLLICSFVCLFELMCFVCGLFGWFGFDCLFEFWLFVLFACFTHDLFLFGLLCLCFLGGSCGFACLLIFACSFCSSGF